MLNAKLVVSTLLAAIFMSPLMVQATPYVVSTNGERAIEFNDAPSAPARADAMRALPRSSSDSYVVGGWRYVGGQAVWSLENARYAFVDGRLVHAEDCAFKTAYAQVPDRSNPPLPSFYRGA